MSRVYAETKWADDDILSPVEPNAEFATLAGEINGHINSDNLGDSIVTVSEVADDVFHQVVYQDDNTPQTFTRDQSSGQDWQQVYSTTITTGDGRLNIEGHVQYVFATGDGASMEAAVLLDGKPVARSGPSGWYEEDCLTAIGNPLVGPGTHTLELVIRIAPGDRGVATGLSVDTEDYTLWARWAAR